MMLFFIPPPQSPLLFLTFPPSIGDLLLPSLKHMVLGSVSLPHPHLPLPAVLRPSFRQCLPVLQSSDSVSLHLADPTPQDDMPASL